MRKFIITGVQIGAWNKFINNIGRGGLYSITKEDARYIVLTDDECIIDFCEMRFREVE